MGADEACASGDNDRHKGYFVSAAKVRRGALRGK
jgi:hypothetical protein